MYVESGIKLVIFNDFDSATGINDVMRKAENLHNIYPSTYTPFAYMDEKEMDDFYLLSQHICRKSRLAQTDEIEKLLLGISEKWCLKYVEYNKKVNTIIFGVLDTRTHDISKLTLDIMDMEYRCNLDLRIGTGTSEYRITMVEKSEGSDIVITRISESIGPRYDQIEMLWHDDYVADI